MSNFKEFLETDTVISKFLNIGLVSAEIINYFESMDDSHIDKRKTYNMLYQITDGKEILKRNPDKIALEIAGQNFVLRRGRGNPRHNTSLTSDKTYTGGYLYCNTRTSPATRVLFEIDDSNISSFSIKIINTIGELQPVTKKEIAKTLIKESSNSYRERFNHWMPRLLNLEYIIKKDDYYSLSSKSCFYYNNRTREIWDELRVWKFRKKFYP